MVWPVLEGRVAVVTGGAKGMGLATVRVFAEAGARVVSADVDEDRGRAEVASMRSDGLDVTFVRADMTDPSSVEALVAATVEAYGRLDCAVNNAAVAPDTHPVADMDIHEFDRILAVDLRGVALCMKYEIAQMLSQGDGGSIVNISSVSGIRPQRNSLAYSAAKHAVIGMTKVASLEYASMGIRVNAVAPGAIDTPMLRSRLEERGLTEEEFAPQLSLLGRFGRPTEVAEASLWLCSDQSSFVTGALLPVDAGYTSR